MSSKTSSAELFSDFDTDSDGMLEKDEMVTFITGFGGAALDEDEEIQRSVKHVFDRVDTNRDGILSAAESNFYWRQIGDMLSTEDVAAWVVHGMQVGREARCCAVWCRTCCGWLWLAHCGLQSALFRYALVLIHPWWWYLCMCCCSPTPAPPLSSRGKSEGVSLPIP